MNVPLLLRVKEQILAEPEGFDMEYWENGCGTTRCIGGWAIVLSGQKITYRQSVWGMATHFIGLKLEETAELFFNNDVVTAQQGADLIDAFILKHGTPEEIVEAQLYENRRDDQSNGDSESSHLDVPLYRENSQEQWAIR